MFGRGANRLCDVFSYLLSVRRKLLSTERFRNKAGGKGDRVLTFSPFADIIAMSKKRGFPPAGASRRRFLLKEADFRGGLTVFSLF